MLLSHSFFLSLSYNRIKNVDQGVKYIFKNDKGSITTEEPVIQTTLIFCIQFLYTTFDPFFHTLFWILISPIFLFPPFITRIFHLIKWSESINVSRKYQCIKKVSMYQTTWTQPSAKFCFSLVDNLNPIPFVDKKYVTTKRSDIDSNVNLIS